MTTRRKKKTYMGARVTTVALSLCLLAAAALVGMYAVGKSDQRQADLEEQLARELAQAKQESEAQALRQAQKEAKLQEEERQEASAKAQREREEQEELEKTVAELESEFKTEADIAEEPKSQEISQQNVAVQETAAQPVLSFSPDRDTLLWPIAGNIILDYSMDKSVYFATLDQYKYNPAVIIQGSLDESVICGAAGKVAAIDTLEETGTTVTVEIGNGYELIYGQLKELMVKEGDYLKEGQTLGYVSEPTRYYSKEGCNVYFEIRKDGESIDPMSLLQ